MINSDSDDSTTYVKSKEKSIRKQLSSAEESNDEEMRTFPTVSVKNIGLDSNDSDDSDKEEVTQKDVFGSDTEEEDKEATRAGIKPAMHDSDDSAPENNTSYQRSYEQEGEQEAGEEEAADDGAIEVDFPVIKADLGEEMFLVKLPNFLSVETRPFDPMYYEDELDEDEVQDEEGRTRLKLKVENTIRWRYARDSEGQPLLDPITEQPVRESNARMVKWSDGSLSLHLGREIFDVHTMDISTDHNHLFVREGSGLQAQAVFTKKLAFRPHSTDSFTHRKLTLSLADKTHKAAKVKLLPFAGENPEIKQKEMLKQEEERIKLALRRENQRRRMKERATRKELTAAYLEQKEDEHNPNSVSISDLKKKTRHSSSSSNKRRSRMIDMSSTDEDDDESASNFSDSPPKKTVKRRIVSDDESASD